MSLVFAYDTYYLIMLHAFSVFILISVNFSIWLRTKKTRLLYAYIAVQGVLLIWMVSKIFKTVAPDVRLKFFFVVCQYVGVSFLGVVFFVFAFLYAKGKLPAVRTIALMSILPLIFLIILITNQRHFLFYSHFDFWGDSFGPAFYFHQAYSYTLVMAGIFMCSGVFLKQFGERRTQALLFSVAILIPLIANIIYVFGWFGRVFGFSPPCDITPISCNISLIMFALAIFRYRLFDDIKIARRNVLACAPDGILIVDSGMRIVGYNDTFKNLYETGCLYAKGKTCVIKKTVEKPSLVLYDRAGFLTELPQSFDKTYETDNGCYYRAMCQPITRNGRNRGMAVRFVDITLKQLLLSEMAVKNSELSELNRRLEEQARMCKSLTIARTRNFIASEVHDVLGHSVVLVISLLEVARLSFGKPGFDVESFIGRANGILKDCLDKSSLLGQPDRTAGGHGLAERINGLKRKAWAASVCVELTVTGSIPKLSHDIEDAVFKLCREGITNSIRHGKAKKIEIILRSLPKGLEVFVIDDGTGCKKVKKGMGITGMEERLTALGGIIAYSPLEGHGFCLQGIVPVI